MKFSIRYKLFFSHFLAIMFVSGSIGSLFYTAAIDNLTDSLRSRLQYSAAILSESFDAAELDQIRNQSSDHDSLSEKYLAKMHRLVESNPDIAYIYVMSLDSENTVRFVLDADTEEPASIGEEYESYIPELFNGFNALSADEEITSDKWGSFMSGYAPIKGGDVPYLVGIDMRAEEVAVKLSTLRRQGIISLLLSILFAYAAAHILSRGMLLRIKIIYDRCLDYTPIKEKFVHHPGDELRGLDYVVSYMLDSVKKTQGDLESQINQRTTELENANRQLKEEIKVRKKVEAFLKEKLNLTPPE